MTHIQEKINCAISNLEKAIKLHDIHMKDSSTATEPSQKELDRYIINAYKCLEAKSIK